MGVKESVDANGNAVDANGNDASTTDADADENAVKLQPKLGLLNAITIVVGSIIGSGIFISPKGVLEQSGSVGASLVIWVLCGLFSLVGAYCYAELGTMITKSGGDYAYFNHAFGPFFAFIRLWVECILIRPCLIAIVALTCGNYVIYPFFLECAMPDVPVRLIAAIGITLLTVINCVDVKWATRVQDVFTLAKCFALCIIILVGIVQLARGRTESFQDMWSGTKTDMGSLSLSFYQGLFAYNSWQYLNGITEEIKNPYVNLPRALIIGLSICTVFYFFANISYLTVLSPTELLSSPAVAVTFADLMFGPMAWIMPIFVAMSTFGGVNGMILTSSRLFFVGAREGHMPEILTYVQMKKETPVPACIFTGVISCAYLASSDINALINYSSLSVWLFTGLSVVIILVLRHTEPNRARPIKVGLGWPIIFIIASVFLVIFPLVQDPVNSCIGILMILSGVPVYWIAISWRNKPKSFVQKVNKFNAAVQRLFLVVRTD